MKRLRCVVVLAALAALAGSGCERRAPLEPKPREAREARQAKVERKLGQIIQRKTLRDNRAHYAEVRELHWMREHKMIMLARLRPVCRARFERISETLAFLEARLGRPGNAGQKAVLPERLSFRQNEAWWTDSLRQFIGANFQEDGRNKKSGKFREVLQNATLHGTKQKNPA